MQPNKTTAMFGQSWWKTGFSTALVENFSQNYMKKHLQFNWKHNILELVEIITKTTNKH